MPLVATWCQHDCLPLGATRAGANNNYKNNSKKTESPHGAAWGGSIPPDLLFPPDFEDLPALLCALCSAVFPVAAAAPSRCYWLVFCFRKRRLACLHPALNAWAHNECACSCALPRNCLFPVPAVCLVAAALHLRARRLRFALSPALAKAAWACLHPALHAWGLRECAPSRARLPTACGCALECVPSRARLPTA